MIFRILNMLALGLAVFIMINNSKKIKKGQHINQPGKLLPEEKNYIYKDMTYLNRGILVTLLDLYRRGKISIDQYKRDSRNKRRADFVIEYKFTLLNMDDLKDHEKIFLDNIFQGQDIVTTDQLTQRAIKGQEFLKKQGAWALAIEKELKSKKILAIGDKKSASRMKLLGLGIFILGFVSVYQNEITGIISIMFSIFVLLIAINMGMEKSKYAQDLIVQMTDKEKLAKEGKIFGANEDQLLELLAMALTMKYFIPLYKTSKTYQSISLVTDSLNEYGGSYFDDAILRAFMGYSAPTREDSLDTNRIDFRLFK
ncbi:MAG: DUF2207 domain-containing protein [Bacillota bacterium]|nr:DUF2207 domain-containing protein [Bacillota bacterium]